MFILQEISGTRSASGTPPVSRSTTKPKKGSATKSEAPAKSDSVGSSDKANVKLLRDLLKSTPEEIRALADFAEADGTEAGRKKAAAMRTFADKKEAGGKGADTPPALKAEKTAPSEKSKSKEEVVKVPKYGQVFIRAEEGLGVRPSLNADPAFKDLMRQLNDRGLQSKEVLFKEALTRVPNVVTKALAAPEIKTFFEAHGLVEDNVESTEEEYGAFAQWDAKKGILEKEFAKYLKEGLQYKPLITKDGAKLFDKVPIPDE